jgi:hypothetical protein
MGAPIKRAADTDDCGCCRCRGVDALLPRRSTLDDAIWGWNHLRSRVSLLGVVVLGVAVGYLATYALTFRNELPLAVTVSIVLVAILAWTWLVIGVRAYLATSAAAALTGTESTPWERVSYASRRIPGIVGTLLLTGAVVLLGTLLVAVVGLLGIGLCYGCFVLVTGESQVGTILTLLAIAPLSVLLVGAGSFVSFRLWLAPEIATVGGYGPTTAVRISWSITSQYRRRHVVVVLAAILSVVLSTAFGGLTPVGPTPTVQIGIQSASTVFGTIVNCVWATVGTQGYLRWVVS